MADIKQAAKWMQLGKHVRRSAWLKEQPNWYSDWNECIDLDGRSAWPDDALVECTDLLADDWEIAND